MHLLSATTTGRTSLLFIAGLSSIAVTTITGNVSADDDSFLRAEDSLAKRYRHRRLDISAMARTTTSRGLSATKELTEDIAHIAEAVKIEMHFLPDVYVPCEVCHGRRYNSETLEVHYKEKNISQILDMTVNDAVDFFKHIPKINRKLQTIKDVGLGYVTLGQPATTLSGGEAQRMKLASELHKRSTGKSFYILDEPTTGLHTEDISRLLKVLERFVDDGNTVLVIEHNLDVIKTADHIIDLGPEGGVGGGTIIATGTPEEVASNPASFTGQYLKGKLQ